eukprot:1042184-Amphidinium_carterae.1
MYRQQSVSTLRQSAPTLPITPPHQLRLSPKEAKRAVRRTTISAIHAGTSALATLTFTTAGTQLEPPCRRFYGKSGIVHTKYTPAGSNPHADTAATTLIAPVAFVCA